LVLFKNKNVRGQHDGTRSRAVIDRVHENAKVAAEKYRACRQAKLALSGPGEWEGTLRVLADGDIRSYQDPNHLRPCQGRKGTLDDDQVMERERQGLLQPDAPPDDVDINLLYHPRDRRDGTGETRRTLSWIWITNSDNPEDTSDNILRAEWAKSRARAARAKEEVLLLREEMRRVIAFLQWKASWWRKRENTRVGIGEDLTEALRSYAREQADLQTKLADRFCTIWKKPLDDLEIVEGADGEDQGEDDDENESGEDEDEAPEGLDEDPDDEDDDMTGPP
jgi:hypothetical protein